jgi:DNA polymerase III delta prime subunit
VSASGPDPDRDQRIDWRLVEAIEAGTLPKQLLISGPAGTGKTYAILCLLHCLACDYPNLRILFCRQTRVSLTDSVLVTYEQEVLPRDGMERIARGASRLHRHSYSYPNGSEVVLGGLDKPTSVLSQSWDIIFLNEAIEASDESWDALWSRLNRPGRPSWLGFLIGDTNPGHPDHWLKKRAVAGELGYWDSTHKANPALWQDGDWTEVGKAYLGSLAKFKGTPRKRYFEGLWVAGPGAWFESFDSAIHVRSDAEYDPRYAVHLSVDTGVHCGAVLWQVKGEGDDAVLTVFGDYYAERVHAYYNANAIIGLLSQLCSGRYDVGRLDPSGESESGFGSITIQSEFLRAGLRLTPWPRYAGSPGAGLTILESFVSADPLRFSVHPRCVHLIDGLANYRRKRRGSQWLDEPDDPQHPYEDLVDPLRSGLLDKFPEGRKPVPKFRIVRARNVF